MFVLDSKVGPGVERLLLPCSYFDTVAGTFTGGVIAIMLAVLRMDIETYISSYLDMAPRIFPEEGFIPGSKVGKLYKGIEGTARFDATELEAIIKAMVAARLGTQDDTLENENAGCRTFVCVTKKDRSKPSRLGSYRISWEPGTGCSIWQAARAASAAPLYFPSI